MARALSSEARDAIRREANTFLARQKIVEPPFPVDDALEAQQLRLAEVPLEQALRRMGVDQKEFQKIDAMLDVKAKSVALRQDLHRHSRKWGCVHEVAHSAIPWHVDLLFYCPIVLLPLRVQKQMELEADAFTSDCLYLGSRFLEEAKSYPFGIRPVIRLADQYETSIHSALRRFVEENTERCCLLVWRTPKENMAAPTLSLHYYVPSKSFPGGFSVGQEVGPDHVVTQAYMKLRGQDSLPVTHEIGVSGIDGKRRVLTAETFFNSYTLFTLAWSPKLSSG